jgi:formylmethanofuran dehydrogenase subunit E
VAIDELDPDFAEVRTKAFAGEANPEEEEEFERRKDAISDKILGMPENELFKIEYVDIETPEKARIFGSVKCSKCGELVAEHRARVENGEFVCIPCFDDYSRN